MSRAWRPTNESPISPSSSFCGTSAATESITMMSTAFDLISSSAICIASSPLVGWLTSRLSSEMPSFLAQLGSRACSASMKAAMPPARWAAAMAWRASVVLPLDSGPNTSMMRPRGKPLPPRARSTERLPLEIPSIGAWASLPSGMIEPVPNSFSIWASVFFNAGLPSRNDAIVLTGRPFVSLLVVSLLLSPDFAADFAASVFCDAFAIRPFSPTAKTITNASLVSRHVVGVVASPP